MADTNNDKLLIRLHVYDTEMAVNVLRSDEALYYKDKKSDKELLYMAMIDIALRHEREMQRNDTQPYDKIMSDLTREIEDALDDKIDENK